MSLSLFHLRHQAKEILAASVLELFPGTQLVSGAVSEIGFEYDFIFPKDIIVLFGEKELTHLEDKMCQVASQKRPIALQEMMRENAKDFFYHLGQRTRGDLIAKSEDEIVSIFRMNNFFDLCPTPFAKDSSQIGAFKLLGWEQVNERKTRIKGTAFQEKSDLKEFLKKYKDLSKRDYLTLGPKLNLLSIYKDALVYHPKGEILYASLVQKWREMHAQLGFNFIHSFASLDPLEMHKHVFDVSKSSLPCRLASLGPKDGDLATIFLKKQDLLSEIISSLHFIDKVIKIFAFEVRISLVCSPKGNKESKELLLKGLDKSGLPFIEEVGSQEKIVFSLTDALGRRKKGPYVAFESQVQGEIGVVYRSLFGSIESWIALLIEQRKQE